MDMKAKTTVNKALNGELSTFLHTCNMLTAQERTFQVKLPTQQLQVSELAQLTQLACC